MKKVFFVLIALLGVCSAQAQTTVQGAAFRDNWSMGLVGGAVAPAKINDLLRETRGTYGLEVTKQFTTVTGLTLQGMASNNNSLSSTILDATNVNLLANFNLNNLFAGYKGTPRAFEVEAVAGIGWAHYFMNKAMGDDANAFTTKYALNFNFNLGEARAWTFSIRPGIVYDLTSRHAEPAFNVNDAALELLAGVTYHFKNHNNGKHYMTLVRAYDQNEIDALNAKINDLRTQADDAKAQLAKTAQQLRETQQALNECRDRKPVVEVQTVTSHSASLEQTVTFRQGKSVVDASQLPNVERVATFLRNHPKATVSIKGYASPEGSAEINARIALARAEAVKTILVEKYKIAANRIVAEGQGVGNMFSEPDWNRVSICTINEAQ
ncbi:MAG: OmpA family protein [Bacteroidales bacterium]|nr:OmpA family protein [Bacteroidales bacterium]